MLLLLIILLKLIRAKLSRNLNNNFTEIQQWYTIKYKILWNLGFCSLFLKVLCIEFGKIGFVDYENMLTHDKR